MRFKSSQEFWIGVMAMVGAVLLILVVLGFLASCAPEGAKPLPIAPDEYRVNQAQG